MIQREPRSPCIDFYDLCEILGGLLVKAWGLEWRERFTPEYPKDINAQDPTITYTLISKVPSPETKELRHRFMAEEDDDGNPLELWGRSFHVIGQFDVWSRSARVANETAKKFARFVDTYTDYLRQQGVVQIFFTEQLEDARLDRWRENWYIRSLRYLVLTQEQIAVPIGLLDGVDVTLSNP